MQSHPLGGDGGGVYSGRTLAEGGTGPGNPLKFWNAFVLHPFCFLAAGPVCVRACVCVCYSITEMCREVLLKLVCI